MNSLLEAAEEAEEGFTDFRRERRRRNRLRRRMEYERQITYPRRHSHGPEGGNLVEGKGIAHSGLVLKPMGPLPYTQSDGKRWWRQAAEYFREGDMREL